MRASWATRGSLPCPRPRLLANLAHCLASCSQPHARLGGPVGTKLPKRSNDPFVDLLERPSFVCSQRVSHYVHLHTNISSRPLHLPGPVGRMMLHHLSRVVLVLKAFHSALLTRFPAQL
jgi:hypothetical protein